MTMGQTVGMWLQALLTVLQITVIPLAYLVWKIHSNDLAHIDARIDDLQQSLSRVEGKLDAHIQWHMTQSPW